MEAWLWRQDAPLYACCISHANAVSAATALAFGDCQCCLRCFGTPWQRVLTASRTASCSAALHLNTLQSLYPQVERIGQKHQAGSDSLLTAQVFFKIVETKFEGMANLDREKYLGELFGYGNNNTVYRPGHGPPPGVGATPTPTKPASAYAISANNPNNGVTNLSAAFAGNGMIGVTNGGTTAVAATAVTAAPLPDDLLLPPAPAAEDVGEGY